MGDAVEGCQQRLQVVPLGELHLVEEEHDTTVGRASGLAKLDQDILKVDVELAAVPSPWRRIDLDLERDPGRHGRHRKAADDRQRPAQPLLDALAASERVRGLRGDLREHRTQRPTTTQLDIPSSPPRVLGLAREAVQQDRLADAAKTPQRQILLRTPSGQALEQHAEAGLLSVAAGELGWRGPGARGVRIQDLIHRRQYILLYRCIWSSHKTTYSVVGSLGCAPRRGADRLRDRRTPGDSQPALERDGPRHPRSPLLRHPRGSPRPSAACWRGLVDRAAQRM